MRSEPATRPEPAGKSNRAVKREACSALRAAPAALLLALSPAVADAQPLDIVASLPGVDRARLLVPDGELAGHAVSVSAVDSRRAPEVVLAEVEGHWRRQGADPVLRAQSGSWSVLSRRIDSARRDAGGAASGAAGRAAQGAADGAAHGMSDGAPIDDGFETLQLRSSPSGGSEGLFTRWLRAVPVRVDTQVFLERLLPDDARAVRQLSSRDAGVGSAETLIARFAHSLDESEIRIERHLRRAGFVPVRAPQRSPGLSWRDDRARFFRGPAAQLLLTLHRQEHGTSVVLYHVRGAP